MEMEDNLTTYSFCYPVKKVRGSQLSVQKARHISFCFWCCALVFYKSSWWHAIFLVQGCYIVFDLPSFLYLMLSLTVSLTQLRL